MTSESKIRYLSDRRKRRESENLSKELLINQSHKRESHHLLGKSYSDIQTPLGENIHKYITLKQNSLSVKERKNQKVMALKSLLSLFETGCDLFRLVIEKEIQDGKNRD